jgi:hypothetical protein
VGNLLDNAAKWSDTGGLVEVRLRPDNLTVRDHGPGKAVFTVNGMPLRDPDGELLAPDGPPRGASTR